MRRTALLIIALTFTGVAARAEDAPAPAPAAPAARLGSLTIEADTQTVIATGRINQVTGLVELLACGYQGKIHESLLVLDLNPVDLHAALLLLGLRPGTPPTAMGQGRPEGAALDLWVHWKEDDKPRRERAERLLVDRNTDAPLPETAWIFSGAREEMGEYGALLDHSYVATYWDPWSVINIGRPLGTNDDVVAVNTNAVPPLNTPIELHIRARH